MYRSPFGGCFQIHHNSPNWRELLEQDIAQKRAELRGEIPPPIHVSVPETPPQEEAPKPVSDHPFDHLSAFDGFAWQGTTHLPCAFGVCDFIVYEDEEASDDESDEPLPTLGQRHLFDFFVASQEKILPPLQEALLRALQTCNVSVSEVESFSDLSQFLESGDLEIHKASSKGRGDLSILFSIKDHSKTISIKWSCTPSRDSIRLKSIHFVD